jgi:hypothetical protein
MAGSSITVTKNWISADRRELEIKLACVGDDGNGSVPATQITSAIIGATFGNREYDGVGYKLYEVWVQNGATDPDAADLVLTDEVGCILFTEVGVIPTTGTNEGTVDKYRLITSQITATVANQGTADALWNIYLRLVK